MDYLPEIEAALQNARTITLEEMDSVKLLNRIDRKYVLHVSRIPSLLRAVLEQYRVLEIDGLRIFSYNTIYFDTPALQFYKDHHNGLTNRVKVRCRQYVESKLSFFEIKKKYMGYRTDKYRKQLDEPLLQLGLPEYEAVRQQYRKYEVHQLDMSLVNTFRRITFVNNDLTERVTIDLSLCFSRGESIASVDRLAIIEVKQEKSDIHSPIIKELKRQRIHPGRVSKYILGLLLLKNDIKQNAFKMILGKINKIQSVYGYDTNGQLA